MSRTLDTLVRLTANVRAVVSNLCLHSSLKQHVKPVSLEVDALLRLIWGGLLRTLSTLEKVRGNGLSGPAIPRLELRLQGT